MYMAFSDFPPTENYVKYWSKLEYYQYLVAYANHYDLLPHIQLQTKVHLAHLSPQTKQWTVHLETTTDLQPTQEPPPMENTRSKNTNNNESNKVTGTSTKNTSTVRTEVFDYLIVATGANNKPSIPSTLFDGFSGQILHSLQYHLAEQVRGKNVLIVGMGESSTDLALSASTVADSVTVWGPHYQDMAPRFVCDMVFDPKLDELKCLKKQDEDKLLPNAFLEIVTTSRIARNLPLGVWAFCLHGLMFNIIRTPRTYKCRLDSPCLACIAVYRAAINATNSHKNQLT
ncbi:hypothetical protein ACA910_001895 [Epithemia clementina (nom. ined.)]